MFRKIVFLVVLSCFLIPFQLLADEGMWIVSLIGKNYEEMKKMGLKLSAEDIYSINHACLKDAIVQFGNGCTGEIVSSEGLIFTNHHCGYGYIQSHSTVEHDYLANGFWALNKNEELACEGLSVKFLVRIEDVTSQILPKLDDKMTEKERNEKINLLSKTICSEATKDNYFDAVVRPLFSGNSFYLFVYVIYKDVRLVGAPPESIGKFGGDTDNWMWPRHTGDFSVFRVYSDPQGNPSPFNASNIPLKPKHHLPVSIAGVKEGDFTMILGYPGRTSRYISSFGVAQAINVTNPAVVKIRDKKLAIMREDMNKSKELHIMYSSKYARTANYWKYFIGQTKGLLRLDVAGTKRAVEKQFSDWIGTSSYRQTTFGSVLKDLDESYKALEKFNLMKTYLNEAVLQGPDAIGFATRFNDLFKLLEADSVDVAKKNKVVARLIEETLNFYKDFNLETEKKLFSNLLQMYYNDIDKDHYPTVFTEIKKKYRGNFDKFTNETYGNSIFANKTAVLSFLENPSYKTLDEDPIFCAAVSVTGYFKGAISQFQPDLDRFDRASRLYMQGLREMNPSKNYYPDANSTMRLSYGKAANYAPCDAVVYDLFTTLDGVMAKEDPGVAEFNVPAKLKELYNAKDYGPYAESGVMKTCFLTNNDITGGNSGSPVINAKGELIGLAFDGNWEAMSCDIAFEPELQRTIVVDVRYVLFIIDKFAGAKNLINEMNIVNN